MFVIEGFEVSVRFSGVGKCLWITLINTLCTYFGAYFTTGVASRRSVHEAGLLALMYTSLHTLLQVQGEGIRNVYRVMPLINFKIPIGHKLTPQLEIYNPHDTV